MLANETNKTLREDIITHVDNIYMITKENKSNEDKSHE